MRKPTENERAMSRQARLAAIVMAVAMAVWVGGQWLGGRMGWDPRYAFLLDFAALAAFVWGLVVTWRVWSRRREE